MEVMPGDDEAMLMQRVAAELEQAIRLHPTQWYPFGKLYVDSG